MSKPKRWKPAIDERYFFINTGGLIDSDRYKYTDEDRYIFGNCFRTRKEAKTKLREIKKILKG